MAGKLEIYKDNSGEFRWRLKSSNGQSIANGGEGFKEKRSCLESIESVKKNIADHVVDDQTA
jgi:uncharacterized protein YegP (UPF0339 family)